MGYLQISTTVGKREDAERIAETLVQTRLAGCVQIVGPISSTYWWKPKIQKAEEWLCMIITEETLYNEVEKATKKIHSYEIPEIIALPIVAGSKKYFGWLGQEIRIRESKNL
jgi:periplasmic divalent cation tolerance protein